MYVFVKKIASKQTTFSHKIMSVKKIHDSSTNLEKMFCLHQKDWKETLQGLCDIKKIWFVLFSTQMTPEIIP